MIPPIDQRLATLGWDSPSLEDSSMNTCRFRGAASVYMTAALTARSGPSMVDELRLVRVGKTWKIEKGH